MSQDNRQQGRREGESVTGAAAERTSAPGRRTLTMGLPTAPRGDGPVAQLTRDSVSGAGDDAERAAEAARWLDASGRPDLHAPVQRRAAATTAEGAAPAPSGSGQPLEGGVRGDMEHAFGADFSAVRIHEGDQAPAIGALAYTQGADIHFAPGQFAPGSDAGRSLLGHELTHVVQQAEGRVAATTQAKGVAINDDSALEREADDKGARAARGEHVGEAGRAPIVAGAAAGSVQRYAFVGGAQVTKVMPGTTPAASAMILDSTVRSYNDQAELDKHAAKTTDYLGNLADGTWLRFSPTGINLLGERHTLVTAEQTVTAVGSTSFTYEPFSSDDLSSSPGMKAAYEKENADRFKTFGVDGVADKKQFGGESLYPKIGVGMVMALPFFEGSSPLDDLKPAKYIGQPIQRYLKIAWGMSADAEVKVATQRAAKQAVEPKFGKMADTHTAVKGTLDAFITALPIDGFLGDELTKPGKDVLLPPLAKYARAVSDAMIEMAADDPSSRLDPAKRADLKAKGAKDEAEKDQIFSEWRDFKFEDNVAAATAAGVRYAGMGQNHLDHLIAQGLAANQHPWKLANVDLAKFKADTDALKAVAVAASVDPTAMSTAELIKKYAASVDPGEKTALETAMRGRWIKVTVDVKKAQENPDDVYVLAKHGGREFKSGEMKMKTGTKNTFWVPVDKLAPINGAIAVEVYDWDALSSDDLISILTFQDPFAPAVDNRPWDGAEYHTTVEFDR